MRQQRPQNRSTQRPPDRAPDAQSEVRYPIPAASAQAWKTIGCQKRVSLNPGLIFDRFVQDWGWREQRFQDKEAKKKAWQEIVDIAPRADADLLAAWNGRWQAVTGVANAITFSLKTEWRFIAGLGRKGPLEVGFTFHRYGFPILPGSSVKGVARAWALIQIVEKMGQTDLKALDEKLGLDGEKGSRERKEYETWRDSLPEDTRRWVEDFRAIFGTTSVAGRAVFFDAIPARKPTLELDIMNPHYPKYYSGEEFPTDWQSPVPVYFLTVAPNTEFRFAVGWRGTPNQDLQAKAREWLTKGLLELGAGAKTSAGYGYFTDSTLHESRTSKTVTEAAPSVAVAPPTPQPPVAALEWRTGIVREYHPDRGRGRLVNTETNEELPFHRDAIEEKGWSPGRKTRVQYAMQEQEGRKLVVKVKCV